MYSIKKAATFLTVAAMLLAESVTSFAAGPGDNIANNSSAIYSANTGNGNVQTADTPVSDASNSQSSSGTSGSTSVASQGSATQQISSGKTLGKVTVSVDAIRPTLTTGHDGDLSPDPVLNLVPLATYYIYDSAGNRIDYGYSQQNDSFVFAENGFNRMMLEHQNVGRWYYRTYSKASGWGPWAVSGETTPDQGTVQAVMFRVKGYTHHLGELYYRAVLNDGTETDWAVAGQACGAIGTDKYIVALKLALWKNGVAFPYPTDKPLDNTYTEGVYTDASGVVKYSKADGSAYTGTGFDKDSNQYYFVDGTAVTGWQNVNGYNVYFDQNGHAVKDLEPIMGAQSSYAIRINKATRTVYVLAKDSSGNYTIPFKTFMCSVGTDTPIGSFHIYEKYRWKYMHEDCYCQFLNRFYNGFIIHSLLYTEANPHTFDAINYNFIDQAISGGCIRLRACDAAWVYNNCGKGTTVTIFSDPWDKGPVEKGAIEQAIPRSQDYDPTDPVVGNAQSDADKQAVAQAQSQAAVDEAEGNIEPNEG